MQTMLYMHNYQSEDDWSIHTEFPYPSCYHRMAQKLHKIKCIHPDGPSLRHAAAVVQLCKNPNAVDAPNVDECYEGIKTIRETLHKLRKGKSGSADDLIEMYPSDPNELGTTHPEIYQTAFEGQPPLHNT